MSDKIKDIETSLGNKYIEIFIIRRIDFFYFFYLVNTVNASIMELVQQSIAISTLYLSAI